MSLYNNFNSFQKGTIFGETEKFEPLVHQATLAALLKVYVLQRTIVELLADKVRLALVVGHDLDIVEKIMDEIKKEEFQFFTRDQINNYKNVQSELRTFWSKKNSY